jgi:peroxiredoxin
VELHDKTMGEPVMIVSIDGGTRTPAAVEFIDENHAAHTLLNDPDRTAFGAYGVSAIPTTVVVDPAGRIMYKHVGFSEGMEEQFAKEIETLLAWSEQT